MRLRPHPQALTRSPVARPLNLQLPMLNLRIRNPGLPASPASLPGRHAAVLTPASQVISPPRRSSPRRTAHGSSSPAPPRIKWRSSTLRAARSSSKSRCPIPALGLGALSRRRPPLRYLRRAAEQRSRARRQFRQSRSPPFPPATPRWLPCSALTGKPCSSATALTTMSASSTANTAKEQCRIPVQREPVAADITRDGRFLLVANHLHTGRADAEHVAAVVSVIDTASRKVVKELSLPDGSGLLNDLRVSPTANTPW